MIGALNHIAIAVPDIEKATRLYEEVLGGKVSEPDAFPEHGVTVVFVELPNTKIEFLEPLGENSPIAAFLEKNPSGGIHHFCLEVDDVNASMKKVEDEGLRVLGPPKIGAHGKPVIFLHPKDCLGTLMEFEEG
ncbi:MAG: methylmalonyl-CoA epimerase [Rhodobacteraceae bacterium]|nr:methylmalonyl-CoA epimerase [Paracoccaceae bacterium]MCY4249351.1 methylmalonyl-CoA epimerase [Paracoccaceae bacterium]